MSLDNNLFTLWFTPSEQVPGDVDCIDPQSSEVIYRKRQRNVIKGPEYFWSLIDPLYARIRVFDVKDTHKGPALKI